MTTTKLTDLEAKMLVAIRDSEYRSGGPIADVEVWNDTTMDAFAKFSGKRSAAGGVMASLTTKGLAGTSGSGREDCCWITEAGLAAIADIPVVNAWENWPVRSEAR